MTTLLLIAGVLGLACADLERGPPPLVPEAGAGDAGGDGGAAPGFAGVRVLLKAACASCHAAGREAGNSVFLLGDDQAADYRATRALVEPANAAASRLLTKASGQGHSGGVVWVVGSKEYEAVLAWIAAGARP